jgi:hypothetical protein
LDFEDEDEGRGRGRIGEPVRAHALRIILVTALLLGGAASRAFILNLSDQSQPLRWNLTTVNANVHTNVVNRTTKAVRYFLAEDAYSAANRAAELNAVRASFAQWQAIAGTHLKFEEGGLVARGVDVNTSDHTNVVFWAKGDTLVNGGVDDIHGVLGLTFTRFFDDYQLLGADIVFNGVDYIWFTDFFDTRNAAQFVEATALHEIGHFIGLLHSPLGGATMIAYYEGGISPTVGLSSDEIAGARTLYPVAAQLAALGTVKGKVTLNGSSLLGAAVIAEGATGNAVAGTLTRNNGTYELTALPPGTYGVRVTPLDPCEARRLVCPLDIGFQFAEAQTAFLPTTNSVVTVGAGQTVTLNFKVTSGAPAFRIVALRKPTTIPSLFTYGNSAVAMRPGQSGYYVGVYSPSFPPTGATLTATGDGLTLGDTTTTPDTFGQILLSAPISVAAEATPGLRSLVVRHGNNLAIANGFLEILPLVRDDNFDGLDDTFQRKHFPLWTAPEAGPDADPDGDTMKNSAEAVAGTVPTNPASLLRIESVRQDASGTTVTWQSVAGRRYQLLRRPRVASGAWEAVGTPVTASGNTAQALDASSPSGAYFYRVQVVP